MAGTTTEAEEGQPLPPRCLRIDCAGRVLDLSRPRIMGILNVTPDSFSDGGRYTSVASAVAHAVSMVEAGADMIDVGGESTRPGAPEVGADEEAERVIEVIKHLHQAVDVPISIDTRKPSVMRAAVEAGAGFVNDIRALLEPGALSLAVELGVPVCLMHMQGEPRNMQAAPEYRDVVCEVEAFLLRRARECIDAGIDRGRILLDPGIGFGKNLQHNLALMRATTALAGHGFPLLLGVSRKRVIGALLRNRPIEGRVDGSVGAAVALALAGAKILRVHDVRQTADALQVAWAISKTED
ncbi:dihydropteroate synthase [Acidihalobacter aeolianus]|uniref:Dihydropteroate synthase n=2 Tax=Acidihalobacter aeolianus TaxID=2792603 RepID=A0A1D8K8Q7_9GAMM|nr:dihydropteroate synthase [Acidihalobacter aeolianus]